MACNKPLQGWFSRSGGFTLKFSEAYHDQQMEVPCGQCMGCRLAKTTGWATRIMNESQMHEENYFLTLTYDEEHYPKNGSLCKQHLTKFIKRYRKYISPTKIRYYACGEYGDQYERPHYHLIIFGSYPADAKIFKESKTGYGMLYQSEKLEKIWGKGMIVVAPCTYESACYVASYVTKKLTGDPTVIHNHYHHRQPEYAVMSRGGTMKGIGFAWYEQYKKQTWDSDSIIMRGHEISPPQFYKNKLKEENPDLHFQLKLKNIRKKETEKRQFVTELFLKKKQQFFKKTQI